MTDFDEKTLLKCAKMLQDYCINHPGFGCDKCIFRDKNGDCKVGNPIDFKLNEEEANE